jgi:CheY-like chemotaxis protein
LIASPLLITLLDPGDIGCQYDLSPKATGRCVGSRGHEFHRSAEGTLLSTRRKILVIEDNDDVRDAVAESLEDAGYDAWVAANGAVAMGELRESNDLPCLILLDLMMPEMDGAQFLQEMRNDPRLSALPVVVVTADGSAKAKATALGTHGGLRKPVQLRELLSTVSKFCQHS